MGVRSSLPLPVYIFRCSFEHLFFHHLWEIQEDHRQLYLFLIQSIQVMYMIELPEARTIAADLRKEVLGKTIQSVSGNFTDHKFTFYYGNPDTYHDRLKNKAVTAVVERSFYVELEIEDEVLTFRDGANIRWFAKPQQFKKSKLLLMFTDGSCLHVTTSMYAAIHVFPKTEGAQDAYYEAELKSCSLLDECFTYDNFLSKLHHETEKLSVKAFLATKQRFIGIGNGVCQDILFYAGLHPKRKMNTLTKDEINTLFFSMKQTLQQMVQEGGRDSEKIIYGEKGGYHCVMSAGHYKDGCPKCGGRIQKEQYLGGSIYYCPHCQK